MNSSLDINNMKENPSVSVVVCCFNSGKYIKQCLHSLTEQTLKNIEVIVIVDGSEDEEEARIIDEYSKKDDRFKVFVNHQNMGTGYSRELGVKLSSGEFIGFVDTDDFVESNCYETLYNNAVKTTSEIAISDYYTLRDDGLYYDKEHVSSNATKVYSGEEVFKLQLRRIKKPFYLRVDWWNKIYKRSLFEDNNITFPHVVRNEGTMSMVLSVIASKVCVVDTKLFHTVARQGSVCRTFKTKNIEDIKVSTLHFVKYMKAFDKWLAFKDDVIKLFMYVLFNHNLQLILKLPKVEREKGLDYLKESLANNKEIYNLFLNYLNFKEKGVERLLYSTLCHNKVWTILSQAKGRDFFERYEGGQRLVNRSKYNKSKDMVTIVTICKDVISGGRKEFFERMVKSVKEQTYGRDRIEHIVIDALSNDGTREYLSTLAESGKIDYWVSESDTGIYNAMNKGPDFAMGDYIIYMNSDDYFCESAIEKLVTSIKTNNSDYSYANAYKVNELEEKVGKHIGGMDKVFFGTPYCHQTLLTKIDCFEKVRFDESYRITMWAYSLNLYKAGFVSSYVDDFLAYFRVGGVSTDDKHQEKFVAEQTRIKKNIIVPNLPLTYNEYEYINHTFRHWSTSDFSINDADLINKLEKMKVNDCGFVREFTSSVYSLIEIANNGVLEPRR
ncbi:glycosyltransferase family 2 protein [Vibrio parahaemolyticus]|uniref:glycosyltransferase family 2 protein n=1 Tax=Vibrio parahaemolyticus TaxID=670 RepID=UPI001D9D3F79|nr:glycosyltransferase family 2 protein [Vibrio parahaemolyticus]EGR1577625.1 glycosyltransferase [Vibrio parahaemolyticus]MDF4257615.1 glycosyltransferase family 2 protein [Vibrio parahaemolyticus]MDF4262532.1 glycosyltransferase family 2 protein [Vibrio parahaemolyticus]MDF4324689.1 glycosyltransferase family 2 protein [Vibrio parahaemolyticus]MDF4993602.1 glycosyltransferase family 2 protein [Vibrio parahaemolyticus]